MDVKEAVHTEQRGCESVLGRRHEGMLRVRVWLHQLQSEFHGTLSLHGQQSIYIVLLPRLVVITYDWLL